VHSPANAAGAAEARARKLAAAGDLDRLARTAGTRFHPTADAVAARVTAITAKRRAGAYLRTTITHDTDGKPLLSWHSARPRSTPRPTAKPERPGHNWPLWRMRRRAPGLTIKGCVTRPASPRRMEPMVASTSLSDAY